MASQHRLLLVVGMLGGAVLAGCANPIPDGESAACAAPTVNVQPASTTAGGQIVVHGENFLGGCPEGSSGDRDALAATEPAVPHVDINIQILDNGSPVTLATVDAENDGTFEISVEVPADLNSGVIELTTDVDSTAPTELVIGIS